MKINTSYLIFKTDKPVTCEASKLRGYIGNKFKNHSILHNHYGKNQYYYSYPLVQYKIINGQASILGIGKGANILKEISSDIEELKMDKTYNINEKIIYDKNYDINTTNKEYHYEFLSPWLALNTKNFQKYINISNWRESKLFLNNILVGNILSMSKGLGIIVNRKLYIKSYLNPISVKYKSVNMKGFTGEFKVKFKIPDFFGFGKGVSQGFGTIKQVTD